MRYPLAITALCAALQLQAVAASPNITIHSPDSADTYSDNSMLWHQLRWNPRSQELVATITFSNYHRVSDVEPRHDETFDFRIPGVHFSPDSGTFSIHVHGKAPVVIATLSTRLFIKSIVPAANTQFRISRSSGHVGVTAIINRYSIPGERWLELSKAAPAPIQRVHEDPLISS